ncbi:copper amine oxidase N-terminal domain-containing protein [Paenibacillus tianjinensis]|uniref:Copper amine oxidase-like N-terminal domain-containing protein n=1 Tax=Paenibacillus tianjinensis TaxID=2810347 RepID=A0ABX7LFA4_9BACL|nr:copper amine oxidase N-terminal domain-containing protein [Paenibacillus tianjinensis]QSF46790.1 hypothetical protein JRJ22_09620 [Paenibacillus tianjinensis]
MRKFILGLLCGLVIASSSVAFASGSIKALLFPASFEINGSTVTPSSSVQALHVNGSTYVPLRFIAENLGATVGYDAELQRIIVKNRELNLKDPDYAGIRAGNLIVTPSGGNSIVTGQLIFAGVGNSKNKISATLSFYNDSNRKIGEVLIKGNQFGVEAQAFTAKGTGDFRAYTTAILHVDAVNDKPALKPVSFIYKNSKYNFTLQLPAYWEGRYKVESSVNAASDRESIHFVTNQGGIIFSILVWTEQEWKEQGAMTQEVAQIWKLGEQGNKVFTIILPGDVQYDPENEEQTAEYHKLVSYIDLIRTSFKLQE